MGVYWVANNSSNGDNDNKQSNIHNKHIQQKASVREKEKRAGAKAQRRRNRIQRDVAVFLWPLGYGSIM